MKTCMIIAAAGLAASASPALAQIQRYHLVPHTTNGVMAFERSNGSLAINSLIPEVGPAWSTGISVIKAAIQVGPEIWIAVQANDTIFRFDHNGKYYGKITNAIDNNRGMKFVDNVVYVANAGGGGATIGLVKFDAAGNHIGQIPAVSAPWDVAIFDGKAYITDGNSNPADVTRYLLDGTFDGIFHNGPMAIPQQILAKANGNMLVAGTSSSGGAVVGIYEIDTTGAQIGVIPLTGIVGFAPLDDGNILWAGANISVYDTVAGASTIVMSGSGQYINPIDINTAAVGACCFLDGTCQTTSIGDCGTHNGVFRGDGVACASAACPPSAACCFPDGTCSLLPADYCTTQIGIWNAGQACGSVTCEHRLITSNASGLNSTTNGSGIFFDITTNADVTIPRIEYVPGVAAGNAVTLDIYTKAGTYVGFDFDPSAWTHLGTVNTTSLGNTTSTPYTPVTLPSPVSIDAGQTQAFYIVGTTGGYRYRGTAGTNPVVDNHLTLESNLARTTPFGGTANANRRFMGTIVYSLGGTQACYGNCDASTTAPVLNVADFTCFLQRFAAGEAYANCDQSTTVPVLNVADFTCFLQKFAAGCP